MNIDRRTLLRAGAGGLMGMLLARAFQANPAAAQPQYLSFAPQPTAKAVIVLWMNGGPSHIDTFDPKPATTAGGPHKAIKTATRDLMISEHMPLLAAQSQKLAVVRGMTSKEGNHQRAQFLMHTGYSPNPTVAHPSIGGWVSALKDGGPRGLPAFVSIAGPSAGAGFLGVQNGPFVVQRAGEPPQNIALGPDADAARFERRRGLLDSMEDRFIGQTGDAKVKGRRALYAKAISMMQSPDVRAFDASEEPEAVRAAYGATDFGRGCLVARRLVELGVPFVEVTLDGWDTHKDNFGRTKTLMGTLDPAFSALLVDLEKRKLLASTLVVWMGDFGRTPRINGNDGRDHHPQAWSTVLAGGGIRGGVVHGATDATGDKVVADAVTVPNLLATVVDRLGFKPTETRISPAGRPIALTDEGTPVKSLFVP